MQERPGQPPSLSAPNARTVDFTSVLTGKGSLPSHMQPLSIRRGFTWTLTSNVVFAISQWGILAVLAKAGSQHIVGQFAIGLAISTPIFMFAGLELRILLATDRVNSFAFRHYLLLRLIGGGLAMAISTAIAYWQYPESTALVIVAVSFGKLVEMIVDTYHGLLQSFERMDHVSRSTFMHGIVSCGFLAVAIVVTQSVFVATMMSAIGRLMILIMYDIPVSSPFRSIRVSGSEQDATSTDAGAESVAASIRSSLRLAILGMPLAIKVLLISLNNNVARYFVAAFCGLSGLGLFVPITAVSTAGTSITRALNQAVAAPLAVCKAAGDFAMFRLIVTRLMAIYAVVGLCGIGVATLFGGPLLGLLFLPEYAAYSNVLVLGMVAATVQFFAGILDLAMIALRRVNILVPLSFLTLALVTLTCWLWVPTYGMSGAALSLSVCRLPRLFTMGWIVWKETRPLESLGAAASNDGRIAIGPHLLDPGKPIEELAA